MHAHRAAARKIRRLVADTGGATLIEYAAITFFVSITLGFALPNFGDSVEGLYERTAAALESIVPDRRDDKAGGRDGGKRGKKGGKKGGDKDGRRGRGDRH